MPTRRTPRTPAPVVEVDPSTVATQDDPSAEVVEVVTVARGELSADTSATLAATHRSGNYTALRASYSPTDTRSDRYALIQQALRDSGLVEGSPLVGSTPAPKMTEKRFSVLYAIYEGYSNREGADHLGMNVQTFKGHQGNLHTQFGVDGRVKAVVEAVRCGILPPAPAAATPAATQDEA